MAEVVLRPLADAFMEVGIFVALLVAVFGWARWRYGDKLVDALSRHRRGGPLVGALLGVSPGCAGAILVMPLAARGTVSYGTAIGLVALAQIVVVAIVITSFPETAHLELEALNPEDAVPVVVPPVAGTS